MYSDELKKNANIIVDKFKDKILIVGNNKCLQVTISEKSYKLSIQGNLSSQKGHGGSPG